MEAFQEHIASSTSALSETEEIHPASFPVTKILYGVQGTGNGHISRACAMNKALGDTGRYDVTWIMSGRPESAIMCCDEYRWYRGMTFASSNGKIDIVKTMTGNNLLRFLTDTRELSLDEYDLIVTDFEPVVAWAARRQKKKTLGIGHQYAFNYAVPVAGYNPFSAFTMKHFAPADTGVGLHWHHFDQPILPPIVDMHGVNEEQEVVRDKVLVYLPFENQDSLVQMFSAIPGYQFYIYSAEMEDYNIGNVHTRAISKTGFKNDLVTSGAIITNSGFELISECLTLGKRILTKPLHGQIEQLSNARALQDLGYATVIDRITRKDVDTWLKKSDVIYRVGYPDVAAAIAQWISVRGSVSVEELSASLWEQTTVRRVSQ